MKSNAPEPTAAAAVSPLPRNPRKPQSFYENCPILQRVYDLGGVAGRGEKASSSTGLLDRARAYVAKMPSALSGSGGHPATLAVARALWHDFALEDDDALSVLREFNARCLPPWTERDLIHKLASVKGYSYRTARGHLRDAGRVALPVRRLPPRTPVVEAETWIIERCPAPAVLLPLQSPVSEPVRPAFIPVPGCSTPRPANANVPDGDWRAVEAAGMAGETLVLAALRMFGPGCRVVGSEVSK